VCFQCSVLHKTATFSCNSVIWNLPSIKHNSSSMVTYGRHSNRYLSDEYSKVKVLHCHVSIWIKYVLRQSATAFLSKTCRVRDVYTAWFLWNSAVVRDFSSLFVCAWPGLLPPLNTVTPFIYVRQPYWETVSCSPPRVALHESPASCCSTPIWHNCLGLISRDLITCASKSIRPEAIRGDISYMSWPF